MVTLTHPKLPNREITVSEQQVRHLERAGWQRKNNRRAKPAKPAEDKPAEPAGNDTEGAA